MTLLEYFTEKGIKNGIGKGATESIMEMMHDGVCTPAQARAQLIRLRKKHPESAVFVDAALDEIGDRE